MPTAKELIDAIPDTGTEALQMALAAERDGKNRKTVVAAYEEELADRAQAEAEQPDEVAEDKADDPATETKPMTHTERRREHLRRNSQRAR